MSLLASSHSYSSTVTELKVLPLQIKEVCASEPREKLGMLTGRQFGRTEDRKDKLGQ